LGVERNSRSLHYATPDFLLRLVALANFMRLSILKAAHVDAGERSVVEGASAVG
jgi:hypothetical protein